MQLVGNSWDQILEDEYHKDYFKKIVLYINKAYKEREIYPPKNNIRTRSISWNRRSQWTGFRGK